MPPATSMKLPKFAALNIGTIYAKDADNESDAITVKDVMTQRRTIGIDILGRIEIIRHSLLLTGYPVQRAFAGRRGFRQWPRFFSQFERHFACARGPLAVSRTS